MSANLKRRLAELALVMDREARRGMRIISPGPVRAVVTLPIRTDSPRPPRNVA